MNWQIFVISFCKVLFLYWTCLNLKFSGDDIEDCSCVIRLGTNSTSLKPMKEGLCNYTLQTSPGSQVSFPPLISRFNFPDLGQLSPHEPSLTEPQGRVRVVGEPRRRSSVVGKLNRFLNNKILQKRLSLFRTKEILWPHSSQLPRTKCNYFLVQFYSSQLQPSCRLSCPGAQFPGRKKNCDP